MNTEKKVCWIIGITAVTAIGFLVILPLMKKYSNKLYKSKIRNEDIDFDNIGPVIVKKEETKEE